MQTCDLCKYTRRLGSKDEETTVSPNRFWFMKSNIVGWHVVVTDKSGPVPKTFSYVAAPRSYWNVSQHCPACSARYLCCPEPLFRAWSTVARFTHELGCFPDPLDGSPARRRRHSFLPKFSGKATNIMPLHTTHNDPHQAVSSSQCETSFCKNLLMGFIYLRFALPNS